MIDFHPLPAFPHKGSKARKLAIVFALFAPVFAGLLALMLGQDANWDFRNYHWYNAYAFLNGRYGFDLLPSQLPYFYSPLIDLPYFLLAQVVSVKTSTFIMGAVQGINLLMIFMLAHTTLIIHNQRHKVLVCIALAILGFLGGGGIALIGTTFYDNITSIGLFLSALLALRFYPRMVNGPWGHAIALALLSGFPAGIMMGLKLPFVVFCVGLCGAFLFVTGPFLRRIMLSFGFGLGILLGLAITQAPWSLTLYQEYGNPVFPYFNTIFQSPFASPDMTRDLKFLPQSLWEMMTYPYIFTETPYRVGEIEWSDARILIIYILLPVCVLVRLAFGRNKKAQDRLTSFYAMRYLLWLSVLSYFVWLALFSIYRYLVPLEMLTPLLIVLAMSLLPLKAQTRALLTACLFLVIILSIQPGSWGRKTPWLDKPAEVAIPDIAYPDNLMILMAGFEPFSHIVPSFPPHIPFVRIQSNFASPGEAKGINDVIMKKVKEHQGPFMLVIPDWQYDLAKDALKYFNLTFSPKNCLDIVDYLFDSRLKLCPIDPLKGQPLTVKSPHE
ncbi:MAG: hypothetical protein EOM37_01775 [Proteobacteria bacterium]|nr:hypothetical protein [Pseudomonadota bacterium]